MRFQTLLGGKASHRQKPARYIRRNSEKRENGHTCVPLFLTGDSRKRAGGLRFGHHVGRRDLGHRGRGGERPGEAPAEHDPLNRRARGDDQVRGRGAEQARTEDGPAADSSGQRHEKRAAHHLENGKTRPACARFIYIFFNVKRGSK